MNAQRAAEPVSGSPLRTDFAHLIDGELVRSGEMLDVINPANGAAFARSPAAGRTELDRAVAAARRAFAAWRERSFEERRTAIKQMAQALRDNQQELAELLTLEQGKP